MHLAANEQPLFMGNRWKTYQGEENDASERERERERLGGRKKERRDEGHIVDANSERVVVRCHCRLAVTQRKLFSVSARRYVKS